MTNVLTAEEFPGQAKAKEIGVARHIWRIKIQQAIMTSLAGAYLQDDQTAPERIFKNQYGYFEKAAELAAAAVVDGAINENITLEPTPKKLEPKIKGSADPQGMDYFLRWAR